MRRRLVTAALIVVIVAVGCTTTEPSRSAATTTAPTGTTTTPPPPEFVALPAHVPSLHVPFSADGDALVVRAGRAPTGLDREQAIAVAHEVIGDLVADANARASCSGCTTGPSRIRGAVAGKVTIGDVVAESGTARPFRDVGAWVVPFRTAAFFCPELGFDDLPKLPADASQLNAVIVTTSRAADAVIFHGAGTGGCYRRAAASVSWDPSAVNDIGVPPAG